MVQMFMVQCCMVESICNHSWIVVLAETLVACNKSMRLAAAVATLRHLTCCEDERSSASSDKCDVFFPGISSKGCFQKSCAVSCLGSCPLREKPRAPCSSRRAVLAEINFQLHQQQQPLDGDNSESVLRHHKHPSSHTLVCKAPSRSPIFNSYY
jgi:hypothetical protein